MSETRPPLRPRSYVEPGDLQAYALSLLEASGDERQEAARKLSVSQPTITKALTFEGERYIRTCIRIIELYSGYTLRPVYRVETRRADSSGG